MVESGLKLNTPIWGVGVKGSGLNCCAKHSASLVYVLSSLLYSPFLLLVPPLSPYSFIRLIYLFGRQNDRRREKYLPFVASLPK